MPQGCRLRNAALRGCLIAGICLWAIPALGQTQEPETKTETPTPEVQQAEPAKPAQLPLPKQEQQQPPAKQKPLCDEAEAGPESNLCQQWRMAQAAEEQVHWTSRLYFLTFWEIGALVLTLLATAAAAIAAIIAARAARDSITVTSSTAERQLRAYVGFTRVETLTVMDQTREDQPRKVHGYQFRVTIENAAATPAIDCTIYGDHCLVEMTDPKDPTFSKAQDSGGRSAIGPHSMVYGPLRFITRAEAQRVLDKKARLFIWWRAEYRDVFDNTPDRYVENSWEVFIPINPEILAPGDPLPSFSFMSYGRQTLN